jgi:hypothetical protein
VTRLRSFWRQIKGREVVVVVKLETCRRWCWTGGVRRQQDRPMVDVVSTSTPMWRVGGHGDVVVRGIARRAGHGRRFKGGDAAVKFERRQKEGGAAKQANPSRDIQKVSNSSGQGCQPGWSGAGRPARLQRGSTLLHRLRILKDRRFR